MVDHKPYEGCVQTLRELADQFDKRHLTPAEFAVLVEEASRRLNGAVRIYEGDAVLDHQRRVRTTRRLPVHR